ncbi:MAG: DEAD/DEAH box helicase family protein [bacterium]
MQENSFETQNQSQVEQSMTNILTKGIAKYLSNETGTEILRPHQKEVFEDFKNFFQEGNTRGYVVLPTGTGKTVLFVELTKALLSVETTARRPRILVVTPTKDLVHQIIGGTGEKGYGKFAPELTIGSYFSDTAYGKKSSDALKKFDVIITTYHSFTLLSKIYNYRKLTTDDINTAVNSAYFENLAKDIGREKAMFHITDVKYVRTQKNMLNDFDIIILDEAHHVLGTETAKIINSLPKDKILIGFTATPDMSKQKTLEKYLSREIHSLELNEAIWLGLLAPIVPIGIKSGISIRGSDLYDESGDFIDSRIRYLSEDPKRNKIIIETAKTLSQNGIGTIISCIAGGEAWHARFLAEELIKVGVKAKAVYSGVDAKTRQVIYEQFEKGEIDVLTFIGVLGEGWDSTRAKAMIGARPTRSTIFSKQRIGRITRPGNIAFAIDIVDEYENKNPAITVADVLDEGDRPLGSIIGSADNSETIISNLLASLKDKVKLLPVLTSTYKEYQALLSTLEVLNRGVLPSSYRHDVAEWAVASRISSSYSGVTDEVFAKIEELSGKVTKNKLSRQGNSIRIAYNINEAKSLIYNLQKVDPTKYFVNSKGIKYISAFGLVELFSKRYPKIDSEIMINELEKIESNIDWFPGTVASGNGIDKYRHYTVVKMYNANNQTIELLNKELSEYFAK